MIGRRTRYVQFSPALDDSLNGNTLENGRVTCTAEISRLCSEPRLTGEQMAQACEIAWFRQLSVDSKQRGKTERQKDITAE